MSLDLTANVDANTTGYERHIDNAINATRRYESALNSLEADMMALEKSMDDHVAKALERQHDAMDKTGKAVFTFGATLAAGFALAANEAVKWESAWAGVTKTTSGTSEQMGQLEEDLRSLALVLPASHEEIAATAEAAGQLGVARENLAAFTKTAIDLGETTNLSAEEAATAIAQMMNVMRSAPDVIDEIGATLVALGNDGASTESQILNMAQRLTGAVSLVGGTETDVLALASAMANLGIQSELGGGAIQRVFTNIYQAAADGADGLAGFAQVAGMSAQEFADDWANDPVAAFDAFLQGLGRVKESGGNVVGTLDDLGIKGTQNLQVMLRLAGAGTELTDALDLSARAWADNTALLAEAEKRYETTESKIEMARNQLRDSAIDIGAVVLPALAQALEFGGNLMQTWSDLPGPLRDALVVLGLVTSAVAILGGAALIAIPKIAAFRAAVAPLESGALKTAGTRLSGMATFLTGPYGIALAAAATGVMLLASAHGEASREIEAYRRTLDEAGKATEETFSQAIENLQSEGWLDYAESLGIGMDEVVAAVTEGGAALDDLRAKVEAQKGSEWNPFNGDNWTKDSGQFIDNIENARSKMSEAERQAQQSATANKELGGSTAVAADGQDQFTTALEEGAGAAGELAEEIKTVGEQLEELSGAFLGNRAAGRAVRDSLRDIREATREYVKEHGDLEGAFKRGSESGDEFAGLLDGLAGDLQAQIDTTERVTGSYEATMRTWRSSRQTLIDVAQQLRMTKEEAREYAEQVLGTPEMIKTLFQLDSEPAAAKLTAIQQQIDSIDRFIPVNIHVSRTGTGGDLPYVSGGTQPAPTPKPDGRMPASDRMGAWSAAGQQLGTRFPHQGAGSGGNGRVTVVRESGPLIGQLKVELSGGATRDDAHRLATAVVNEVSLAQRSGRWTED